MQAVKATGSKIEVALGRLLFARGHRYRKNDPTVFGKPDFTFKRLKIAIFVDGEFWHGKDWEKHKQDHKTNQEFWFKKIGRNIERDKEVNKTLEQEGWTVLRFWGKEIKKDVLSCVLKIEEYINKAKMKDKKNISMTEWSEKKYKYPDEAVSLKVAEKASPYSVSTSSDVPFPPTQTPLFTFIDLFAGIGGFRLALQHLGGKCVFTSEWDKEAQKTYKANFGEMPFGDITQEETKSHIPDGFDVLCAGFPCQAFSIAGKRGGFEDTRGTLFFDVAEIIKKKRPRAIFLENVKGLLSHNKGKTLDTILNVLRNDLGYYVPDPKVLNARHYGVPQNRERIYIVGFRADQGVSDFEYPSPTDDTQVFLNIREDHPVPTKYYLSTRYLQTLKEHKARHESKGNGFGYEIIPDHGVANAIVVGGMGRERNLVVDDRITDFTPTTKIKGVVNREGIRRMTPREWARLQGFPDHYIIDAVADASAYKQFGNSVAVPAIQATAREMLLKIGVPVNR